MLQIAHLLHKLLEGGQIGLLQERRAQAQIRKALSGRESQRRSVKQAPG